MNCKGAWYEFCTPHLEWLNWEDNLDMDKYVATLIERAKQINSNTIVYPFESGGYLLYPGTLAPIDKHINGADLFGKVREEARNNGLKFSACFLGAWSNCYMTETHPEWIAQDGKGEPIKPWHGYNFRTMCINSPFGDYLLDLIYDVIDRYKPDGIYIEGLLPTGCGCNFCKNKFRSMYGKELPKNDLMKDIDAAAFFQNSVSNIYRKIRNIIDEIAPQTAFFGTSYFPSANPRSIGKYVDVISHECQWGYSGFVGSYTIQEVGMISKLLTSEGEKPSMGTCWISKHVDNNYAQRSKPHVKLNCLELLLNGSIVQFHTQNAFEVNEEMIPVLNEFYTYVEKLKTYMEGAKTIPYAAILNWAEPSNQEEYINDAFKGTYRVLLEEHIPFDVITISDIDKGVLQKYKLLILPDARALDGKVVDIIGKYVENGGGVTFTYRSGMYDKNCRINSRSGLDKLAGITRYMAEHVSTNDYFPVQTYFNITESENPWNDLSGKMMSFNGEYEDVETESDVNILGWIYGYDFPRMHREHTGFSGYPGRRKGPMITTRKVGMGRVVYIAGNIDAAFKKSGDQHAFETLAYAFRWAAEEKPKFVVECPSTVEINTFAKEGSLAVLMLNQTMNCPVSFNEYANPVRNIIPVHDLRLKINIDGKSVKNIKTLNICDMDYIVEDYLLTVSMKSLDEFNAVLIDFE